MTMNKSVKVLHIVCTLIVIVSLACDSGSITEPVVIVVPQIFFQSKYIEEHPGHQKQVEELRQLIRNQVQQNH